MRKSLTILFAAALVLAFTLPVQAQQQAPAVGKYLGAPDFNVRGLFRAAGTSSDNVFDFDDDIHDARRLIWSQWRWWFDTSFEGKYGGTMGLEWNWFWGVDAGSVGGQFPALTLPGGTARGQDSGEVPPNLLRMKHAYVWFMVPGTPVKVTAGLQNWTIDPDLLMFAYQGDGWGIRADFPIIKGVLNATLGWIKWDEGRDIFNSAYGGVTGLAVGLTQNRDSDDSTFYLINLTGALAKWFTFGTYHVWLHVGDNGSTRLDWGGWNFHAPNVNTFAGLGGRRPFDAMSGDYFWHGFHVSVNPGIFYSRLHFNYFWGNQDRRMNYNLLVPAQEEGDMDPSGWALIGRFGIRPGPWSVGIKGWYFSGNDNDAFDPVNPEWDRWSSPDGYFAPFEIFYTGLRGAAINLNANYVMNPGGSAGLALEADWQVTKKLLLDLIAGYIWATEEWDKPFLTTLADKGMGWEVDLRATYKIYSNLSLDLVGAYFVADSGLDHFNPLTGVIKSGDNAYELFWRIAYDF